MYIDCSVFGHRLSYSFQLQAPIHFDKLQSPIHLASSPPVPGTMCTLSGWGLTVANGRPSPQLLKMHQALVSNSVCEKAHRVTLTGSHLCAYNKRGIGACQVNI